MTTINNNNNTKTTNKIKKHFRNSSQTKPFTYGLIPHHKTQLHPRELSPRRPRLPLPRLILRGQPVLVVQTKPLQPQRPIRHKTPLPQRPHLMPRQLAPCPRSRPEAREKALKVGAHFAFDPSDEELRKHRGLNAVFDFAGVASVRKQGLSLLGEMGRLVIIGIANEAITIPNDMAFTYMRTQLLGHYGSERHHTQELVEMVVGIL